MQTQQRVERLAHVDDKWALGAGLVQHAVEQRVDKHLWHVLVDEVWAGARRERSSKSSKSKLFSAQ